MKLSPEDYDRYYAALGIQRSDLLSTDAVSLAELPPTRSPRPRNLATSSA
jgi:hypothetical protein